MDTVRTAIPATPVITTADLKAIMKVEHTDDDTYIGELVKSATEYCQKYCRRQFINTTFQANLDEWPDSDRIYLDYPPLVSVQSIQYVDTSGNTQTWSSANYSTITKAHKGFVYSTSRPSHKTQPHAISINYTAGYGTAATSVPSDIITAVSKLATHHYVNREAVVIGTITGDLAFSVHALLDQHVVAEVVGFDS